MTLTLTQIANGFHTAEGFVDTALHGQAIQVLAQELLKLAPASVVADAASAASEITNAAPIAEALTPNASLQQIEKDVASLAADISQLTKAS